MQTFTTPAPITATLRLVLAQVRITATERSDTIVDLAPTDPGKDADVRAADETTVELTGGKLLIKTPRQWRPYGVFGGAGSVTVTIDLPAGSSLDSQMAMGDIVSEGRLDRCRVASAAGHISVDEVGAAHLTTSAGDVSVDRAASVEIAGAGTMRVRAVTGKAVIKNMNGDTWLGDVAGDLRCTAANGDIAVDHAQRSVVAKTANGSIRVGEVGEGSVAMDTSAGQLEIGIAKGTAAMLDVRSRFGSVRNELTSAAGPDPSDRTVQIRARTAFGDIVIRRPTALARADAGQS